MHGISTTHPAASPRAGRAPASTHAGLSWRDAVATILVAGVVVANLAVDRSWGWPMLGSNRSAALAVVALGLAACIAGWAGTTELRLGDPYMAVGATLGSAALVLTVAAASTGSHGLLTWLVADVVVLWTVATLHHAVAPHQP